MRHEPQHVQKVAVFTRLILPKVVHVHVLFTLELLLLPGIMHVPPYGKTGHKITNGGQITNFPVTGIPLLVFVFLCT